MRKKWFHVGRMLLIALFVLGSLQIEAFAPAAKAVTQAEIDELKNDAESYNEEKEALQEQIDALENDLEDALTKKTLLDQQSAALANEISAIETIIADYETLIGQTEVELADAQQREAVQYERFCERVRAMEENGTVSYWSVLFKAEDFTDLLSRLSDIQEIMDYDQGVINALKETQAEIAAKQADLEAQKAEQGAMTLAGKPVSSDTEVSELRAAFEQAAAKLSDTDALIAPSLSAIWNPYRYVAQGARRSYAPSDTLYKCLVSHETSLETAPDVSTEYWSKL